MKLRFLKTTFILALALLADQPLKAQVNSPAAESMPQQVIALDVAPLKKSEYSELSVEWKVRAEANPFDENAWLNYYKAERYKHYSANGSGISNDVQKRLNGILASMEKNLAGSFAFEYCSYLNGNKSNAAYVHLRSAYAKNPGATELIDDMLSDAIIRRDEAAIQQFTAALSHSGIYSASEVEYSKNVLNSIEKNAVLITNGNVDTYPILLIQRLQNFRTDVKVISLDFLNNETYAAQIAGEYAVSFNRSSLSKKISKLSSTVPVYISLTLPPDILNDLRQNLYCTGLAMKHSRTVIENLPSLVYNWEYLFSKLQLQSNDPLNKNYILPLILLDEYYRTQGKISEADSVRQIAMQLSARYQMQQKTNKFLD